MRGRTIILVSHHVQLCAPGAKYVVALDNGRVQFQGDREAFMSPGVLKSLSQSTNEPTDDKDEAPAVEDITDAVPEAKAGESSETSSTTAPAPEPESDKVEKKAPRKLIEEEKRAVGRISKDIWMTYIKACGGVLYWTTFALSLVLAALSPVFENGWLRYVHSLVSAVFAFSQIVEYGPVLRCRKGRHAVPCFTLVFTHW